MQEIINALLQALVNEAVPHVVAAAKAQIGAPAPAAAFNTPAPAATGGMFGTPAPVAAPSAPAAAPSVTPEMIQALITPLVQVEQVRTALQAQMTAMGVAALPDVTPAQMPELYARFQEVKKQAKAAGLLGDAPAAPPSLI